MKTGRRDLNSLKRNISGPSVVKAIANGTEMTAACETNGKTARSVKICAEVLQVIGKSAINVCVACKREMRQSADEVRCEGLVKWSYKRRSCHVSFRNEDGPLDRSRRSCIMEPRRKLRPSSSVFSRTTTRNPSNRKIPDMRSQMGTKKGRG
eukprot:TRINITY_DN31599_c0_g1_i1.p2 TRINITY_DN31599_c0_g1~~TRINITY_DN31599_c0_g1_i1.p2  ORF type:complete len:152 (-),score=18.51 TRINITY_DN31599_c0_g1_i1:27-482(-)